jgi:rod shape-determining protein MreD
MMPGDPALAGGPATTGVRVFVAGLGIALAVVLQGSLVARLPLPGGAPNLAVLLVVGVALAAGPAAGLGCGFTAGLVMDLMSDHPVGVLAICLTIVGFAVGLLEADPDRSAFWPVVVVAVAAAGTQLVFAALAGLLGAGAGAAMHSLPASVGYDVLLTPFVIPLVAAAERRVRGVR